MFAHCLWLRPWFAPRAACPNESNPIMRIILTWLTHVCPLWFCCSSSTNDSCLSQSVNNTPLQSFQDSFLHLSELLVRRNSSCATVLQSAILAQTRNLDMHKGGSVTGLRLETRRLGKCWASGTPAPVSIGFRLYTVGCWQLGFAQRDNFTAILVYILIAAAQVWGRSIPGCLIQFPSLRNMPPKGRKSAKVSDCQKSNMQEQLTIVAEDKKMEKIGEFLDRDEGYAPKILELIDSGILSETASSLGQAEASEVVASPVEHSGRNFPS